MNFYVSRCDMSIRDFHQLPCSLWFVSAPRLPKKKIDAKESMNKEPLQRKKSKVKKPAAKGRGARK